MLETISLEIVLLEIKEEVERLLTSECLKEEIDHNLEAMQIGNLSNQERIVLKQGLITFQNRGIECYNCGKYGHLQRNCRAKPRAGYANYSKNWKGSN